MRKIIVIGLFFITVTAGCIEPDAVIIADQTSDATELSESASLDFEDANEDIQEAVRSGRSTPTYRNFSTAADKGLVSYEGDFYSISKERNGTDTSVVAELNISISDEEAEYDIGQVSQEDGFVVRDFVRLQEQETVRDDLRFSQRYNPDEINNSVILTEESLTVGYNGTSYRIDVLNKTNATTDLYSYTSEKEFDSVEEYAEHLKTTYVFGLENVSGDIWEEARNGGYYGDYTDEYGELREQFESETAFERQENGGTWYARYDGNIYKVEMDWVGY